LRWKRSAYSLFGRMHVWLTEHQAFLLLLAAFTVFRLLAVVALRPGGFIAHQGPDQLYYFDMSRFTGSGLLPFFDFWMEYPPLMPWLATLAYRLSLYLYPWDVSIFWFNLVFRLLLLPFDVATLVLVYKSVLRLSSRDRALQVAGLWALLFAPLFALLTWFDPLTLFFLVLGLYGQLTDRPALAGGSIGFGFMAKVLPIGIWPVGLFSLRSNRQRAMYVACTAISAGLVVLPPLIMAPAYVVAMFRALLTVSSWETVWALLEGYTGYGLVAPLAARVDPAAAVFSVHPSILPWPLISLGFAVLYAFLITRHIEWTNKSRVVSFALFSLTVLVLHNKGYSPQWAVYLGTLALLALPTGRGLGYALVLSAAMIVEWPVAFILLDGQGWFLAAVIVLRTAVIALLSLESLARALPGAFAWRVIQRTALPLALLVSVGGVFALAGPTWHSYAASRLETDPLAPLIKSLRAAESPSTPIVVLQPDLLERLYTYLPRNTLHLFPNAWGDAWADVGKWLSTRLRPYDQAWLLYDNTDEARRSLSDVLRTWFDIEGCPVLQTWYGPVWAGHYVLAPELEECPVDAGFEDGLHLVTATLPHKSMSPGSTFCLRLMWAADAAPSKDYAVFVHLLSAEGRLIAQSDTWPPEPTSMWTVGETVLTSHGLVLPRYLSPGHYTLHVGLYALDDGTRLPLIDGSNAVRLGELVVEGPTS